MKKKQPVLVATDGSCLKNPGGPIGWAWVAQDGRYFQGGEASGTNQIAELRGVLAALTAFPDEPLTIQVDSEYAMKSATVWSVAWERNGWRNKDGKPVSNLALMKMLRRMMKSRSEHAPVRFVKVPGHDPGNRWPLNTAVDQLAGAAARRARAEGTFQTTGTRAAFTNTGTLADPRGAIGNGDAPGQRCPSCDAIIRPVPPHCRCDLN